MSVNILLVDDSLAFAGIVRQFLALLPGAELVGEARDGRDGLAQAERLRPDLVLMDISMPVLNGVEAARRMLGWADAPRVVFLTTHDNEAYRRAARELGALGFVCKADLVAEVAPIIDTMLAARRQAPPWDA